MIGATKPAILETGAKILVPLFVNQGDTIKIHTREEFRHTSVTVPVCQGQVVGLGLRGYLYAMEALTDMTKSN